MKKIQKQFLGCFGLGLVATMTIVAASLPPLTASATSPITDTINLYVFSGEAPDEVDYNNTTEIAVDLVYTDADGQGHHYDDVYSYVPGTDEGSIDIALNPNLGYGEYDYTITATGWDGAFTEEHFSFLYAPFTMSAEQDPDTGETINVTVGPFADDVDTVQIYINGVLVATVDEPGTYKFSPELVGGSIYDDAVYHVQLVGLHTQTDGEGNPVLDEHGNPVREILFRSPLGFLDVNFEALPTSPTGTPDTGRFFKNLNVSKEDYLITGLIIFFIICTVALGIISRNHRANTKTRRRK